MNKCASWSKRLHLVETGCWDVISSAQCCVWRLELDPNKHSAWAIMHTRHQVDTAWNNTFNLSSLDRPEGFSHTPNEVYRTADLDLLIYEAHVGWTIEWYTRYKYHQQKTFSCLSRQSTRRIWWTSVMGLSSNSRVGRPAFGVKKEFPQLNIKTYRQLADLCWWNSYIAAQC